MIHFANIFCSTPVLAFYVLLVIFAFSLNIGSTDSFEQQPQSLDRKEQHSQGSISSGSPLSQKSFNSDFAVETKNVNNWVTVNHDVYGTRSSNQTIINKENVVKLHIKWRLVNDVEIQDPPVVVGDKGYVQDYGGTVIAFDTRTGNVLWKVKAGTGPTM